MSMFYYLFSLLLAYGDGVSGITSGSVLEMISNATLIETLSYNKTDKLNQDLALRHGQLYQQAQSTAVEKLKSAMEMESLIKKSGNNLTPAQLNNLSESISRNIYDSIKLKEAALKLRTQVFLSFNNTADAKNYNPQKFVILSRTYKWLSQRPAEIVAKDFMPSNWRLVMYGSSSKPKTAIEDMYGNGLVQSVYEKMRAKGKAESVSYKQVVSSVSQAVRGQAGTSRMRSPSWLNMPKAGLGQ